MAFFQGPPQLRNPYDEDPLLASYVRRKLGGGEHGPAVEAELREIGEVAIEYYGKSLADRENEPVLTQWDAWGQRIDHIEVSPLWKDAQRLSSHYGLVAAAYEPTHGVGARLHQFAVVLVLGPSLDLYSCPLAMTDGAARTLLASGNEDLINAYVPHLTTRDPAQMWTSGQWMTERTGGSDVSGTETVARQDADGQWRLYGTKWFTSATTSQVALTLARPEGGVDGSRGLALFAVETRDGNGRLRNILVNRLKDKLGTRKVPTAELTLDGAPATLVGSMTDGVRAITPMLGTTRTWNAVSAVGLMRRSIALAKDFATRRSAFGGMLIDKPLHIDTLAGLEAEYAGAFLLAFRMAELLGRAEHNVADEAEAALSRVLTPVGKLTTGKQAVAVVQEAIEACGGAGYVEDTGLPRLLADANVLPIWEGTTNVLSLDTLRALSKGGVPEAVVADVKRAAAAVHDKDLVESAQVASAAAVAAMTWAAKTFDTPDELEAGARRFAMTLGRAMSLAYLCEHAQWCVDQGEACAPALVSAARRYTQAGVNLIGPMDLTDARRLVAPVS